MQTSRTLHFVVVSLALLLSASCSIPTIKGYRGPDRPDSELVELRMHRYQITAGQSSAQSYMTHVDPRRPPNPDLLHDAGYPRALLLPGEHTIRGYVAVAASDILASGLARFDTCTQDITFTAQAGRSYVLKHAFDPVFIQAWEEEAMDQLGGPLYPIKALGQHYTVNVPAEGGSSMEMVGYQYFWFWIEDLESGEVVAGSPNPGGA